MSEFSFYGSQHDALSILAAILQPADISVTPSLNHPTPRPISYRHIEQGLLDSLAKNRRLYITGAFSKLPLHLKQLERGDYAGTYVICQYRGGPSLSISLPDCKPLSGAVGHLIPGVLFCSSHFWFEDSFCSYSPPADVKAAYSGLKKRVKLVVKRRRVGESMLWIGDDGYELLQRNGALILTRGNWVDANGAIIRSNLANAGSDKTEEPDVRE